jgi:hypothetical protein
MRDTFIVRALTSLALTAGLLAAAGPAQATLSRGAAVQLDTSGSKAHDIVLAGNHAYVTTDTGRLVILDVATNPDLPAIKSSLLLGTGPANGVEVVGNFAYVATYKALKVVNVSNPSAPVVVATRTLPKGFDVTVKVNAVGNAVAAYVASFYGEVYVFNVTTPTNPVLVRTLGVLAWREASQDASNVADLEALADSGAGASTGIDVDGDILVATDWRYGRIIAWNVASPLQPDFVGTHHVPFVLRAEVDAARDQIYMFSAYGRTSGIYSVPITHMTAHVSTRHETCPVCGYFPSNGKMDMGGLAVSPNGRYLPFAGGKRGEMHLLEVTNVPLMTEIAEPFFEGHAVKMPFAMGFAARGNRLYAAGGLLGVVVFTFSGTFE